MNNRTWRFAVAAVLIAAMVLSSGPQTVIAASKYVVLEAQWEDGRTSRVETLLKDGVTYGNLFSLGSASGMRWGMEDEETAVLSGHKKRIVVYMGSRFAEVDGRKVDMGREPVWYISHLYVPIRFLAAALDGTVSAWNPSTGQVTVSGLDLYLDAFSGSMMGHSYMIRAGEGDLRITNVYTGHQDIIPLGMEDINVNTHDLAMNFEWTSRNLMILNINVIDRMTGEYDLYALVFKNQGLIRKSVARGLSDLHETMRPDGHLQLLDDESMRVIEDGTGHVLEIHSRDDAH